jgi:transposase
MTGLNAADAVVNLQCFQADFDGYRALYLPERQVERSINGKSAEERGTVRQERTRPLVEELQVYMREQRAKLSRGHDLAKAIDYILKRWAAFTLFLDDGRACLSNNAAERAVRGIALGRKSWLFCGSDRGRSARCRNVQPDRHRQDERHRPAGLAGRHAGQDRHASGPPARRIAAVELDAGDRQIAQAPHWFMREKGAFRRIKACRRSAATAKGLESPYSESAAGNGNIDLRDQWSIHTSARS